MNFEAYVFFIVIEWLTIQILTLSIAYNLLLQSLVLQELIKFLKSSINYGSTGLETEGYLFLNTCYDGVPPNPFDAP